MKRIKTVFFVACFVCIICTSCTSEKANSVISKIDAIGTVTESKEDVIIAAQNEYDSLSDSDKAHVKNYAKLQAAETELNTIKRKNVENQIDSIGSVNEYSKDQIVAAEKALNELKPEIRESVSNVETLKSARKALNDVFIEKIEEYGKGYNIIGVYDVIKELEENEIEDNKDIIENALNMFCNDCGVTFNNASIMNEPIDAALKICDVLKINIKDNRRTYLTKSKDFIPEAEKWCNYLEVSEYEDDLNYYLSEFHTAINNRNQFKAKSAASLAKSSYLLMESVAYGCGIKTQEYLDGWMQVCDGMEEAARDSSTVKTGIDKTQKGLENLLKVVKESQKPIETLVELGEMDRSVK